VLLAAADIPSAGGPTRETVEAFERYVARTESRLAGGRGENDFLAASTPERRSRLRRGAVLCEPRNRRGDVRVAAGLIHDWVGAVYIPRATVEQVLALVRDYDRHRNTYSPEVVESRILSHQGDDFSVYMRLLKRKGITVVLDTEHEIHYERISNRFWESRSRSTRIVEIARAGRPYEHPVASGKDHGFLWRLNSYWRFREEDGGTYVECEAVSLSRTVPAGLAWLIEPIVRRLPMETLSNTLKQTRAKFAVP
jgi:hypothetical protein